MTYLSKIEKFCKENNLFYSVISADKLNFEEDKLINIPFVNYTLEERLNPKITMEKANSIIFLGVPYFKNEVNNFNEDYHILVKKYLKDIELILGDNCQSFVDTGPLFERGFALESGLSFCGYNTSAINENYGSYFNIGYILTEEKIKPTNKKKIKCLECGKCIKACPTKSLEKYKCNYNTCISYLTQKKGLLTIEEMNSMGESIYGCEICQLCCPHNEVVEFSKNSMNITALEILKTSKKEFVKYKDLTFYWRGLPTIKRNALISLYNSSIDYKVKKEIIKGFINSENEILNVTAKTLYNEL